jgi:hypothetical protein
MKKNIIFMVVFCNVLFNLFSVEIRYTLMNLPALKGGVSEDFSLKSLSMRGNKSPTPPALRPKGRGIIPLEIKKCNNF